MWTVILNQVSTYAVTLPRKINVSRLELLSYYTHNLYTDSTIWMAILTLLCLNCKFYVNTLTSF